MVMVNNNILVPINRRIVTFALFFALSNLTRVKIKDIKKHLSWSLGASFILVNTKQNNRNNLFLRHF